MTRKRLRIIVLAGLIIVEMSTVAAFAVQNYVRTNITGDIVYGCPTLQASTSYSDSSASWIVLTCPNGPATAVSKTMFYTHQGAHATMYPNFSPPPGLLGLFAVQHGDLQSLSQFCQPGPYPFGNFNSRVAATFLTNGISEDYYGGGPLWDNLDYCAVVKNLPPVSGFSIQWTVGRTPIYVPQRVELSGSNTTLPYAAVRHNATIEVQIKSINGLIANFTLASGIPGYYVVPTNVILKAGGTNMTMLTVELDGSATPGLYPLQVIAHPNYGLRFYGDYSETPLYLGTSTILYITIT